MVSLALVLDAYSRRILGWQAARSMTTGLVLDARDHAVGTRRQAGIVDLDGLVCHTDAGAQYPSIAFTDHLTETGIDPPVGSVGSVGDAPDNTPAESVIGLVKTERIKPEAPWHSLTQVDIAYLEHLDWFNHRRLFDACGDIPPTELEPAYLPSSGHPHRGRPLNATALRTRRDSSQHGLGALQSRRWWG